MRRPFLLSTLGILTLVGTAFAGPAQPAEAWAGGVVLRVDATARTIDVKQGEHETTYTLAPDAEVTQGKKSLSGSELSSSIGHQITLRYTGVDDARVATQVTVLGLRKESSSKAATTTTSVASPSTNS